MDNNIFRDISYGVYVVSTMDGERPTGCIANSIMQITSEPATIAVSVNHDNFTNECIRKSGMFAFSILAENSNPGLIGIFGYQSGRNVNKFESVEYEMTEGLPVVNDSCGYVICKVIDTMETKTHTVFLGEVLDGKCHDEARTAMTYAYYHKVMKGKSPKNAPTYQKEELPKESEAIEEDTNKKKYVCQVCGYVYEGASLPKDYRCPICGVGSDKFMRVEE